MKVRFLKSHAGARVVPRAGEGGDALALALGGGRAGAAVAEVDKPRRAHLHAVAVAEVNFAVRARRRHAGRSG